ncbi:MAG: hypothetical protein J6B63_05775 [Treponema sp.]|nr:hypothetical protein [Treponema sp.]MBP3562216.1 hypothetical protein [Treponema sp.]MBP3615714.1 hypothetical protein [Alphaproteobacteria bacterium]
MDSILNYQASIFGSFSNIKYSPENIERISSIFPKFSPNTIPITAVDIRTNQLITDNRLQFVSDDKQYYITFLPERIDFVYNLIQGNSKKTNFEEIQKEIFDIITKIAPEFSSIKGNRLANSCNFLTKVYSKQDIIKEINKYSSTTKFFDDTSDNIAEWQIRINNKRNFSIKSNDEDNNNIINLSLARDSDLNYRFLGTIDINTNPKKDDYRFTILDLKEYVTIATENMKNISKKINND